MKKHLFLKSLLIAIGLLITSINTAWAYNETYIVGDLLHNYGDNKWTSTDYPIGTYNASGTGSNYMYVANGNYFQMRINGKKAGQNNNWDMTTDGTSSTFYRWAEGEASGAAHYTGYSGIVKFNCTSTVSDNPVINITRPDVYIRHNWSNGEWSNKKMTDNNDGTYTIVDYYSGTKRAHVGPEAVSTTNPNSSFKDLNGDDAIGLIGNPGAGDKCLFTFDSYWYRAAGQGSTSYVGALNVAKIHTITFNMKGVGGDNFTNDVVCVSTNDQTVSQPDDPSQAGYTFGGWYTDEGCTVAYNFNTTVTSSFTLYAKWTPVTYSVTINSNNSSMGTLSIDDSSESWGAHTIGITNKITVTPNAGYYFTGWSDMPAGMHKVSDATTINGGDAYFYADGTGKTITANFSPMWAVVGGDSESSGSDDAMGDWSTTANEIQNITTAGGKTTGWVNITLEANTTYQFKLYNNSLSGTPAEKYYSYNGEAENGIMVYPTNDNDPWTLYTNNNNSKITTAGKGTYKFTWNSTDHKLTVDFPTSYSVTFGYGTGGSTVTATGSVSGSITTGQYVAEGEDVTFTQTAASGYTFKEWNTQADGEGTPLGTGASLTLSSIGVNKNVYAIYTPNVYKITFDYQNAGAERGDGDRFSDVGSTLVDGSGNRYINVTYGEIVSGTMPKAVKDGYVFGGWYVDQASTDKKPIDENGSWRTITGYTDADKKWIHAGDVTLYARFWAPSFLSISFSPEHAEPQADVTATISFNPFLSHPGPEGNYTLCYTLTTAAGVALRAQPEWRDKDDATYTVTFKAPSSPGDYSLLVKLFAGLDADCSGAPITYMQGGPDIYKFEVEDMNPVTVTYVCGGVELLPSTTVYATWNNRAHITPPSIAGMKFDHWEYANCTIVGGSDGTYSEPEAEIYAFTAGSVKAVYTQGTLFFKDTKGWVVNPATDSVYIYFYSANKWTTSSGNPEGTGSNGANFISGPFGMRLLEGTDDVYYFDEEKYGTMPTYAAVAFSKERMKNYDFFAGTVETPCNVVYVNDASNSSKPMIVPLGNGATWNFDKCRYYAHDLAPLLQDWGYALRSDIDSWNTTKHKFKSAKMGDLSFTTTVYYDQANYEYQWKIYNGDTGYGKETKTVLTPSSTISPYLENRNAMGYNLYLQSNFAGEYTFTQTYSTECSDGGTAAFSGASATNGLLKHMKVKVDYPVVVGDFRLFYDDKDHPGNVIKKRANGVDVVDMFVESGHASDIKVQTCTAVSNSAVTWGSLSDANYDRVDFSDILLEGGSGVYSFTITQNEAGTSYAITNVEKYAGRFYVRTNCVNGDKWNYKDSKDAHAMTYSDYSTTLKDKPYSHYYVKDSSSVNIRFTVATDNSEAITDTVFDGAADGDYKDMWGSESLTRLMNVRFTYNQKTNKIWRAYTEGPQLTGYMTLRCDEGAAPGTNPVIYKSVAGEKGAHQDTLKFVDMGNWVYQLDAYGDPNVYIKLTANIHNSSGDEITQYLKGKDNASYDESNAVLLIGGSGEAQHMRITYDFKTERMTTAWLPSGTVTSDLSIHADVMLLRKHQQGATSIVIGKKDASNYAQLSDVEKAYGVMEFEKSYINNTSLSRYERNLYWISFPFNVKLSDVFGFGKYGQHWIIEYYDGKGRAQKGYWADSEPNWKYVTEEVKDEFELKANEGYILALALSNMGDGSSIWEGGKISSVYLYFPSKDNIGNITNVENYNMPLDSVGYKCNITRDHRNVKDSYWHCIGVPSFALNSLTGVSTAVPGDGEDWSTPLPYVYKWDSIYNTLSIASTSTFKFEAMKSYLIQYANNYISWANVTNKASVVARRRVEGNNASFYEWKLNLLNNGQHIDHTYVRLSNDENVTDGYDFGNDLSKEFNSGSNIYTFVDDVEVAGNVKPIRTETTIVPVGVKIATTGEYTFSMPEGTNGVGVILVDNIAGTRTNLALEDYTVNLTQGNIDGRFLLEISPIAQTTTDMENVQGDDVQTNVRKVMVDGILYIVKDGKVFDARGSRLQ